MMDKNPYDTSIDWLASQSPAIRQEPIYTSRHQQIPTPPATKKTVPPKQARMPKQRALELVDSFKKGIVISSVVSFGLLGLLATGHAVGTTASTTKTSTPVTSSQPGSSTTPSTSNSSSSSSSSNNSSSSNSSNSSTNQGGFSFGSSSSQSSVSGTSVS